MEEIGCSPNLVIYTILIDGCCKNGEIGRAKEVFSKMEGAGLPPNQFTFTVLVNGLCKKGFKKDGFDLFEKMKKDGVLPDLYTYNVLINEECNEGRIFRALELFDEMRQRGVACNVVTYNTLIGWLCRKMKVSRAETLLDQMKESGLSPNLMTYNTLIDGFCNSGRVGKAFTLFNHMKDIGLVPCMITYNTLISGFAKIGNMARVNKLVREMEERGLSLSKITHTILIDAFSWSNDMEKAVDRLRVMNEAGLVADAYNYGALIHGWCCQGNMMEASKLFSSMAERNVEPNQLMYNAMIKGYCKEGNSYKALILLKQMRGNGMVPNAACFNMTIRVLCHDGKIEDADFVCGLMIKSGLQPSNAVEMLLEARASGSRCIIERQSNDALAENQDNSKATMVLVDDDVLHEILVRVDPSFIFDCIDVCKGWLEVITSPEFRKRYQKRWKTDSKLVGFMMHGWGYGYKLSACSELGRIMDGNKSLQLPYDHFISKSGAGDGLILYGSLSQKRLYVSKADEMRPIQLPPPPDEELFKYTPGMAILSQGNSYQVILVTNVLLDEVIIHTFSSSTDNWEKSEVTRPIGQISHFSGPGMVSSNRGLVYWRVEDFGSVVMYDANNRCISWINRPPEDPKKVTIRVRYGLSPQGNLSCAISSIISIDIWRLDDDGGWNPLHSVDSDFIYQCFASFVPWRCDSFFVLRGLGREELCLYNLHTKKIDSCPSGDILTSFHLPGKSGVPCINLVPLTMADLGVWPSSPFSNTTETSKIHGIKQLLAW